MEAVLQGKSFGASGPGGGDTWNWRENQFPLSSQKEERVPAGTAGVPPARCGFPNRSFGSREGRNLIIIRRSARHIWTGNLRAQRDQIFSMALQEISAKAPKGRPIIGQGKAVQQPPPWVTIKIKFTFFFFVIRPLKANDEKERGLNCCKTNLQAQPQRVKANRRAFGFFRVPFAPDPLRLVLSMPQPSSRCSVGVPPASSRSGTLRVLLGEASQPRKGAPCP